MCNHRLHTLRSRAPPKVALFLFHELGGSAQQSATAGGNAQQSATEGGNAQQSATAGGNVLNGGQYGKSYRHNY